MSACDEGWVTVRPGRPERALPLVCDSPHSGTRYPADFGHAIDLLRLRSAEDTHVDRLWAHVPEAGATLVAARFARTYIDVNRAADDLDAGMLAAPWPAPLNPSHKTVALGLGLVWRQVAEAEPIYQRKLQVAELQRRIACCWQPYHDALDAACDAAVACWGQCWHLNLHSMPGNAYQRLGIQPDQPLADFVLGDHHGASCEPGFVQHLRQVIEAHGWRVALNEPYAGQALVRRHGRPHEGRHSLQIEVNRALYMDEATREPNQGYERLRADLDSIVEEISREVRRRCGGGAR